jgi:hypothetical protein
MAVFSDCQERGVKKLPFNVYYTKKRQDDANLLSTSQEDKWLVKKEKIKMSLFYAEGDKRWAQ